MPTNPRSVHVRRLNQWLRKHFPVKTPVTIRIVKPNEGMHGWLIMADKKAAINICQSNNQHLMMDTLLEEYSHLIRAECPVPIEDDHDDLFWAILAAVTRKYRGD